MTRKQSILILGDEVEITDLLELYLNNEGYRVYKFYTGREALECIRTSQIDLAVLDITDVPEVVAGDIVTLVGKEGRMKSLQWK